MQLKLDKLNAITEFRDHLVTHWLSVFFPFSCTPFLLLPSLLPKEDFSYENERIEKEILKITDLFQCSQVTYFRNFFTLNLELDLKYHIVRIKNRNSHLKNEQIKN